MLREILVSRFSRHHTAWSGRPVYRQAVQQIKGHVRESESKDHAVVLEDANGWRTALLGLAPNSELPLHDHPYTRGMLCLVEGAATIHHYDVFNRENLESVALLKDRGEQEMAFGDYVLFGRRLRNLHTIRSHQGPALIFSVRQRPTDQVTPSLYALVPQAPPSPQDALMAMVFPAMGNLSVD